MQKKQKKQTRKSMNVWVLLLALFLMTGCANNTTAEEVNAEPEVMESAPALEERETGTEDMDSVSEVATGNEIQIPEAPEGYVYDYQVSNEPIPVEIAELGGPVQGTIHAYPSLILKELTRLELENDPERKREAEEYGEEIKAYLLEQYGAECEVEIMDILDDFEWKYYCIEKETGYIFGMSYCPSLSEDFRIYDAYLYSLGDKLQPQIDTVIKEIFGESFCLKIFLQPGHGEKYNDFEKMEGYTVYLHLSVFSDQMISKLDEQKKILELWDNINYLNTKGSVWIFMDYYNENYENIIKEKYKSSNRSDYAQLILNKDNLLLKNNEIQAIFSYDSYFEEKVVDFFEEEEVNEPKINLTTMLDDYKKGVLVTEEWDYWIN